MAPQVGDGQLAEDVINDRGGHLDVIIEFDRPVRLEPREQERFHELFQRHTMLEPQRDRDREAVHQAAEGRALLVHVQEDLPQRPVGILTRPEVELVTADNSFLRVAEPPFRHAPSFGQVTDHHSLGYVFRHLHDVVAGGLIGIG